jgi:hypothetical protein
MTARRTKGMNPLPSLLRASAWDAGNISMRTHGREKWNEDDWNAAAATQERLIKACYGRDEDHNEPNRCYLRFGVAERMEKSRRFQLDSDLSAIMREIDGALNPEGASA